MSRGCLKAYMSCSSKRVDHEQNEALYISPVSSPCGRALALSPWITSTRRCWLTENERFFVARIGR